MFGLYASGKYFLQEGWKLCLQFIPDCHVKIITERQFVSAYITVTFCLIILYNYKTGIKVVRVASLSLYSLYILSICMTNLKHNKRRDIKLSTVYIEKRNYCMTYIMLKFGIMSALKTFRTRSTKSEYRLSDICSIIYTIQSILFPSLQSI